MGETAITGAGQQSDVELQVDPTFQAARISMRPTEYTEPGKPGVGGHYYVDGISGALTGVGANGAIFSYQWTDATLFSILHRVSLVYYITTAYTTAQMNDFELVFASSFTAPDTGGAAVVPSPKRRAGMAPNSAVGDIRMATTAALAAGTRTLDSTGYKGVADGPPNVAIPTATLGVTRQEMLLYDHKEFGQHPKIFNRSEGFIVRMITAMGAVGVIKAMINAEWAEARQF
jgi:hypothetical protein